MSGDDDGGGERLGGRVGRVSSSAGFAPCVARGDVFRSWGVCGGAEERRSEMLGVGFGVQAVKEASPPVGRAAALGLSACGGR
ncbi:hypothetical protein [Nonomuraea recticatena]|uniref:hypothetical protein n=1 Tax=Nonomuraea recticatena TaxID=46178 RepID=UPI00361B1C7C